MRKLALLFVFFLAFASHAGAANVYFAQTSAGGNTGADCADAIAKTAVTWTAGNTYHICGAITSTSGTVAINITSSGTSGSPIVLLFESGASVKSPSFPGDPGNGACSSACGGIEAIGQNYIIIDGGTNGVMQNTLTGATSETCIGGTCQDAPAGGTVGIFASGSHNIIRNVTINNIYLSCGATNCTDNNAAEAYAADIRIDNGSTDTYICGNTVSQAYIGISSDTADVAQTPTVSLSCASNSAPTGTDFFANTTSNICHHIQPTGQGGVNIWYNDISGWTDWIWPGTGNGCHTDGMISFSDGSTIMKPNVYDNYIHGDLGLGSPTGFIFCTYNGSNGGSSCLAFNNVLNGTGSMASGNDALWYVHSNGGSPMKAYNNTFINGGYAFDMDGDSTTHMTMENNIFQGDSGGDTWAWHQESSNQAWSTLDFTNFNVFYQSRSAGAWNWNGTVYSTLTLWTAGCKLGTSGGSGTCDDASVTTNPNLSGTFTLNSGSSAIGLAANLTSLAIAPLNQGAPQTFGVGASCGTGCLARPSTGAWDSGAYPFTSGGVSPPTQITPIILGSLPPGQVGSPYSASLSSSSDTPPNVWSVNPNVPGLALSASTGLLTGTPTAAGSYNLTFGLTDSYVCQTGQKCNNTAVPYTATLLVSANIPPPAGSSLFPTDPTPATVNGADTQSLEVGMKFSSTVAGTVTGVKFYKVAASTGLHTGHLWSSTGTLLGSIAFSNEMASGWQTASFATPLAIAAGSTYTISVHTVGYGVTKPYAWPVTVAPLAAPASAGTYAYGAVAAFPSQSYDSSNYWVDVVFVPGATPPPPPPTPSISGACSAGTIAHTESCSFTFVNVTSGTPFSSTISAAGATATVTGKTP